MKSDHELASRELTDWWMLNRRTTPEEPADCSRIRWCLGPRLIPSADRTLAASNFGQLWGDFPTDRQAPRCAPNRQAPNQVQASSLIPWRGPVDNRCTTAPFDV